MATAAAGNLLTEYVTCNMYTRTSPPQEGSGKLPLDFGFLPVLGFERRYPSTNGQEGPLALHLVLGTRAPKIVVVLLIFLYNLKTVPSSNNTQTLSINLKWKPNPSL